MPREMRKQLRKPFPNVSPDISAMNFGTLHAWKDECMRQEMAAFRLSFDRYRWRRELMRASDEFSKRVLAHKGPKPDFCDNCGTRPVSNHVAYDTPDVPRFAHYCSTCSPSMPLGWMSMVVMEIERTGSK